MKTIYLECTMGAAGDMLQSALLELLPNSRLFIDKMNALGIPGVHVTATPAQKCGIVGTHITVTIHGAEEESHDHHHHDHNHAQEHCHSGMHEIEHIIGHLDLSESVRKNVLSVYHLIAQAESHAHGKPVSEIHFHEVGTMDAIADITGVCLLIEELGNPQILASPIHVGSGSVHCAHGILPVPAPATAYILQGVPTYGGSVLGELCTPTGAALLKHFVKNFGAMPAMITEKIGYGMGNKDFEAANCVRAFLGEVQGESGDILELSCNLDDMTPEAISFACERMFEAGALEVFTTAVGMKKSRPGILLTCLCALEQHEKIVEAFFKHTTTLGIREHRCARHTLAREIEMRSTPYGTVTVKSASGWGVIREKTEFEDRARIARAQNLPLSAIE